jgi:hypothetical protein
MQMGCKKPPNGRNINHEIIIIVMVEVSNQPCQPHPNICSFLPHPFKSHTSSVTKVEMHDMYRHAQQCFVQCELEDSPSLAPKPGNGWYVC